MYNLLFVILFLFSSRSPLSQRHFVIFKCYAKKQRSSKNFFCQPFGVNRRTTLSVMLSICHIRSTSFWYKKQVCKGKGWFCVHLFSPFYFVIKPK